MPAETVNPTTMAATSPTSNRATSTRRCGNSVTPSSASKRTKRRQKRWTTSRRTRLRAGRGLKETLMSEWKWDVDQAKGGGVDVLYGIYLIQDDLDRGGWVLRLDPIRGETLGELQALSKRIEDVLNPSECPTNCGENV